ncbi:MAG: hypothetical protein M3R38_20540 [Actinomycetota bacterium]|nr:hypothetical protein [Actinomycetota bacterium]
METDQIQYAVCERNEGYPSSLELGRVYRVLPDLTAAEHGMIRVVDESGEDYLYPQDRFATPRPKPRGKSLWKRVLLPFGIVLLLQRRVRTRARR